MLHDPSRRRISPKELAAKGWTPLGGRTYKHKNGWVIEHCGHPTALYPYALYKVGADQQRMKMILAPNGHAWHTVAAAVDYVEAQKGKMDLTIWIKLSVAQHRLASPILREMSLRGAYDYELNAEQLKEFTAAAFKLPHSSTREFRTWDSLTDQLVRKRRELETQVALRGMEPNVRSATASTADLSSKETSDTSNKKDTWTSKESNTPLAQLVLFSGVK